MADDSEQLVIGATDPLLTSTKAQWAQHRDPARSPIILRRVDAGYDCDQLMAERSTLFPPDPSPDW